MSFLFLFPLLIIPKVKYHSHLLPRSEEVKNWRSEKEMGELFTHAPYIEFKPEPMFMFMLIPDLDFDSESEWELELDAELDAESKYNHLFSSSKF